MTLNETWIRIRVNEDKTTHPFNIYKYCVRFLDKQIKVSAQAVKCIYI